MLNSELLKAGEEFHKSIIDYIGGDVSECSCSICQSMCEKCPCLGTPFDIINLIEKGHAADLIPTLWVAGLPIGIPQTHMLQLKQNEDGSCVLFKDGKCSIHEYKPLEGKLANCKKDSASDYKKGLTPSSAVALLWSPESEDTAMIAVLAITSYMDAMDKINNLKK